VGSRNVTHIEGNRNAYRFLVGKPEGKGSQTNVNAVVRGIMNAVVIPR
jgi:hypothetical protein